MGMHRSGRAEVEQYWSQGIDATDWVLEVLEGGGNSGRTVSIGSLRPCWVRWPTHGYQLSGDPRTGG